MDEKIKHRSDAIIRAALPYIAKDGWSWEVLMKGAIAAGYDAAVLNLCFEKDVQQALSHYSAMLDEEMITKAKAQPLATLKIRDRIHACIIARLEAIASHKEVARRTARYLALPHHSLIASKLVYKTINTMWYTVGDRSTDFSFYTKRATLAAVYTSTLFYWLKDDSENFTKTHDFLNRRLENIMVIPQLKQSIRRFFGY